MLRFNQASLRTELGVEATKIAVHQPHPKAPVQVKAVSEILLTCNSL